MAIFHSYVKLPEGTSITMETLILYPMIPVYLPGRDWIPGKQWFVWICVYTWYSIFIIIIVSILIIYYIW